MAFAGRVNDLDSQIRKKNDEIRDNRASLQGYVPAGMTIEDFMALPEDAQIAAKIAVKEQDVQAVQRANQLQQRAGLTAITLPVFPVRARHISRIGSRRSEGAESAAY